MEALDTLYVSVVELVGDWLSLGSQDETIGPDPFYDLEQHALLGVANISLECLLHDIEFVYDAPVVAPTGKVGRVGREGGRERER